MGPLERESREGDGRQQVALTQEVQCPDLLLGTDCHVTTLLQGLSQLSADLSRVRFQFGCAFIVPFLLLLPSLCLGQCLLFVFLFFSSCSDGSWTKSSGCSSCVVCGSRDAPTCVLCPKRVKHFFFFSCSVTWLSRKLAKSWWVSSQSYDSKEGCSGRFLGPPILRAFLCPVSRRRLLRLR